MTHQLTSGFYKRAYETSEFTEEFCSSGPILQILSLKKMDTQGTERYRLVLSDGEHFSQGMLATQFNHLIEEGQMKKHSIICLEKFSVNDVQNKR